MIMDSGRLADLVTKQEEGMLTPRLPLNVQKTNPGATFEAIAPVKPALIYTKESLCLKKKKSGFLPSIKGKSLNRKLQHAIG